jgi:muramoyltetrapeptide carboxypeptidase
VTAALRGRRRFLLGAAATLAGPSVTAAPASVPANAPLIKPRRLSTGDLVGLIAPGGVMSDDEIQTGTRHIESLGLRVRHGDNIRLRRGNYAGTPAQQVQDLHAMFEDRDVKAVWGGRGGSGGSLMLPLVRYDLLRANPKILVGFSDVTALHLAVHRHAGLVTFHGPASISTFSDYSVAHLRAMLMEPQPRFTIHPAEANAKRAAENPAYLQRAIVPGVATGRLIGGNLSVLSALVGTPYAARIPGRLFFLEDVREAPYRINRMLTQLAQGADLAKAAGAMLGIFSRCEPPAGEPSLTLAETIDDHFSAQRYPSAYGYSFGHVAHHFTIPLGVRARLDTTAGTLELLEPAVT